MQREKKKLKKKREKETTKNEKILYKKIVKLPPQQTHTHSNINQKLFVITSEETKLHQTFSVVSIAGCGGVSNCWSKISRLISWALVRQDICDAENVEVFKLLPGFSYLFGHWLSPLPFPFEYIQNVYCYLFPSFGY